MRLSDSGFTLIELLVVILIIALLATVVVGGISKQIMNSRLKEAASQVAGDIERMRSGAIRTSQDSSMTIAPDGKTYTVSVGGVSQQAALPDGVVLQINYSGNNTTVNITKFGYSAPYGTVSAMDLKIKLTAPNTNYESGFGLMGVTGKVNQ